MFGCWWVDGESDVAVMLEYWGLRLLVRDCVRDVLEEPD